MVRLSPLRLYRIRNAPKETLRCRQRYIRVRLPTELPKRADAETQVFGRERGESIAHERHTLKCNFD
jgi:hypothetical protein